MTIQSGSVHQLLGDLVPHRLLALDAIRLPEAWTSYQPFDLPFSAADAASVGDQAVDQLHVRAEGSLMKGDFPSRGMKTLAQASAREA